MAAPDDDIFCAKRVWDQRAEIGFMKGIEDSFQSLADKIIAGSVSMLDREQKKIADAFYVLWRARADHRVAEGADPVKLRKVTGHSWTADDQERLEKRGILFVREDGTMPDRFLRGFRIQREIDAGIDELSLGEWGIFCTAEGEFIVPDHPGPGVILPGESRARLFIPVTPKICLCWGVTGTAKIGAQQVAVINRYFNAVSHRYLFARELGQCPLNPQTPTLATWQAP